MVIYSTKFPKFIFLFKSPKDEKINLKMEEDQWGPADLKSLVRNTRNGLNENQLLSDLKWPTFLPTSKGWHTLAEYISWKPHWKELIIRMSGRMRREAGKRDVD